MGVSTGVVQWVGPLVLCSRCVHALTSPATSPRHPFCLALTTPTLWFWTYHTCAEAITYLALTAINDYVIAQWVCTLELMTLCLHYAYHLLGHPYLIRGTGDHPHPLSTYTILLPPSHTWRTELCSTAWITKPRSVVMDYILLKLAISSRESVLNDIITLREISVAIPGQFCKRPSHFPRTRP